MEKKYSPRIWIHELDRKGVASTHALIHFQPDHEHKEYLSKEEFDAIVKSYEEKCDRLKKEIVRLQAQVIGTDKA